MSHTSEGSPDEIQQWLSGPDHNGRHCDVQMLFVLFSRWSFHFKLGSWSCHEPCPKLDSKFLLFIHTYRIKIFLFKMVCFHIIGQAMSMAKDSKVAKDLICDE